MCLPKIWQPRCVAQQVACRSCVSNSSSVISRYGVGELTPAQLTEHVDAAVLLDDACRAALRPTRGRLTSTGDERGLAAELLDRRDARLAALCAAAGDDDVRPGLGQALAQRAAQHAGAADDDGHLAVEAEQFLQVVGMDM